MRKYVVKKIYWHSSGPICLSPEQVASRCHLLTDAGGGIYLPKGELCFKVGEVVGLDIELNKALSVYLQPVAEPAEDIEQPEPQQLVVEQQPERKPGRPKKR
jgi:hypothetical protein